MPWEPCAALDRTVELLAAASMWLLSVLMVATMVAHGSCHGRMVATKDSRLRSRE